MTTSLPGFGGHARKPSAHLQRIGLGASINYATRLAIDVVAAGDFNADGLADLAVCNTAGGNALLGQASPALPISNLRRKPPA